MQRGRERCGSVAVRCAGQLMDPSRLVKRPRHSLMGQQGQTGISADILQPPPQLAHRPVVQTCEILPGEHDPARARPAQQDEPAPEVGVGILDHLHDAGRELQIEWHGVRRDNKISD